MGQTARTVLESELGYERTDYDDNPNQQVDRITQFGTRTCEAPKVSPKNWRFSDVSRASDMIIQRLLKDRPVVARLRPRWIGGRQRARNIVAEGTRTARFSFRAKAFQGYCAARPTSF